MASYPETRRPKNCRFLTYLSFIKVPFGVKQVYPSLNSFHRLRYTMNHESHPEFMHKCVTQNALQEASSPIRRPIP